MFKMIGHMVIDLLVFLVLWGLILVLFTSFSSLIFGHIPVYGNFTDNLIFHFEAALGNWDVRGTCRDSQKGLILKLAQRE